MSLLLLSFIILILLTGSLLLGSRIHQSRQKRRFFHSPSGRRGASTFVPSSPAPVGMRSTKASHVIGPAAPVPLVIAAKTLPPIVCHPMVHEPAVTIAPPVPVLIIPPARPVWDERGWTMHRHIETCVYEGEYRVWDVGSSRERRFAGRILEAKAGITIYIADPPPEIKRHPKHPCFQLVERPEQERHAWFILHWHRAASDPDTALLYLEKVLDEAINRR